MPGYVSCDAGNCIHNGFDDELYLLCMAPVIELHGDAGGPFACSSYKDYHELGDYQERFYKAVRTEKGPGRLSCKGKKIEINGHVFFTDSHPMAVEDGTADLTHGPSGMYVGTLNTIRDKWERNEEKLRQRTYTPVEELPPAEWIEPTRGKDGELYHCALRDTEVPDA